MTVRQARPEDEPGLRDIDAATWTTGVSPAPPPSVDAAFFGERIAPADVLVAEAGCVVAGYAALGSSPRLASRSHVLEIRGLAVHPARQRRGVGRRLVEACIEHARSRGARKLSLRVLGGNAAARRLYESCGFTVEGVLREEFFLGGRYVDDVLMACMLAAVAGPGDDRRGLGPASGRTHTAALQSGNLPRYLEAQMAWREHRCPLTLITQVPCAAGTAPQRRRSRNNHQLSRSPAYFPVLQDGAHSAGSHTDPKSCRPCCR